jgi:hypothetical protein
MMRRKVDRATGEMDFARVGDVDRIGGLNTIPGIEHWVATISGSDEERKFPGKNIL